MRGPPNDLAKVDESPAGALLWTRHWWLPGLRLGLTELFHFEGHAGYDGVILGLPGTDYQLEFTQHADGSPCPAPTRDNLMALYFASLAEAEATAARLAARGACPCSRRTPLVDGRRFAVHAGGPGP
ncbi:MAG: hypothetical protein ACRDQ4_23645 [Pseudonocardiaceae bacterium]